MTKAAGRLLMDRDVRVNPYLAGAFAPIRSEDDFELTVEGEIPAGLRGALYRIGPNPQFDPRDPNHHWFAGDGMVHGFWVDGGKRILDDLFVGLSGLKRDHAVHAFLHLDDLFGLDLDVGGLTADAAGGLEGTLFRNGPGKFRRPGGSATHWFDGDGLMRSFSLSGGAVTLAARFADTPKRRTETELDAVVTPGFGTVGDSRARIGSNDDANAANTAVMVTGDKVWALWEGGSPLRMDAGTLATEQFVTLRDDLKGMPFQAHPRYAPDGTIWNVGTNGDQVIVWHLQASGALIDARVLRLPRASYLHDFTATERHLIFVLQPWVFDHAGMPFSTQFAW
eukprot:gene36760-49560_t